MRSHRGLAAVLGAALVVAGTAQATAQTSHSEPRAVPANGDVLRSEPADFFLDPLKLLRAPATARRVLYRSTDTHDRPIDVSGTVLTPHAPWLGLGPRPVVGYAPGTQGVGDECAPSRQMAMGTEYEGPFVAGLLSRGYGVVVTDYEGLGTPGMHTYVNRAAGAHAVLDAIRAAQRLPEAGLPDDGPVATAGYSQGGGASAGAVELYRAYAPELKLKGAYAGAVPADLGVVARAVDGNYAAGFLGYSLLGLDAAYPELDTAALLNDAGRRMLAEVEHQCTVEVLAAHAFRKSADLTADGRPLTAYLGEEPYASRVEEQRIGVRKPGAPVLVVHSALDDIVPYGQGAAMVRQWCAQGANVRFSTSVAPTHAGGAIAAFPEAFAWLEARFAGLPALGNC